MSIATSFKHPRPFPFEVPSMTTEQIDDLIHPDAENAPYVGVIRGKTLEEAQNILWNTVGIHITGEIPQGDDPPYEIDVVANLGEPRSRVSVTEILYNENLDDSYRISVKLTFGGIDVPDEADDPTGINGTHTVTPIIYDTTTGDYTIVFSIELLVESLPDFTVLYGALLGYTTLNLYGVSSFGTLWGETLNMHVDPLIPIQITLFGDETYAEYPIP